jgi:lactoylglutathione lyase
VSVRIEHVALWAVDLEVVCAFYVRLGASVGPLYVNERTGFSSRFLTWYGGQARLEVMTRADMVGRSGASRGWAHVALTVGSEEAVDALAAELSEAGVPVVDGPRRTGDGYYECVVLDPEGNRVELTA